MLVALIVAVLAMLAVAGAAVVVAATRRSQAELRHRHDAALARADAAEAAAAAVEARLRDILEGAPDALVVFTPRGEVAVANEAATELLAGRHGNALVLEAIKALRTGLQQAGTASATRTMDLAGPPRRSVQLTARLLPDGDVMVVTEDVTERRRIDEVRRDFVANISHELKTPIGAMALLAETMSEEDEPALLARLSQRLHREALRVSSTIDDLLLLSRIEADSEPVRDPVDLRDVVLAAAERVRPVAQARSIEVRLLDDADDAAPSLRGDRRQLESAVYNLLENAVKYSDEGGEVTVRTTRNGASVGVEVADRGIGIPAKDLERVFERFYRVDRARSRTTGGTGLGLAIVRHVANNHGGTVQVASREGEGSTFRLQLPVRPDGAGGSDR
ncbi:MAG: sensor histidine kinase [Acidimicrobiia bacterium]